MKPVFSPIGNAMPSQERCFAPTLSALLLPVFVALASPLPGADSANDIGLTAKQLQDAYVSDIRHPSGELGPLRKNMMERFRVAAESAESDKHKAHLFFNLAVVQSFEDSGVAVQKGLLTQALERAKRASWREGEAVIKAKLAMVHECEGNVKEARALLSAAVLYHLKTGQKAHLALDLCNLGMVAGNNGNSKDAIQYIEQSLELSKEIKSDLGIAFGLSNLSAAYQQSGDHDTAKRLYDELQNYRSLAVPFFFYHRKRFFSSDMPPLPPSIAGVTGVHTLTALKGQRQYYDFDMPSYRVRKTDPMIPCGFIEAPYFLP
jgi:tetratricopeptide (TPR) repeat protein